MDSSNKRWWLRRRIRVVIFAGVVLPVVICPDHGLEKKQANDYSTEERVSIGIILVKLQYEGPSASFQLPLQGCFIPRHE